MTGKARFYLATRSSALLLGTGRGQPALAWGRPVGLLAVKDGGCLSIADNQGEAL